MIAINWEMADSILEVTTRANKQLLEELKGDDDMYETLMEIMDPQIKVKQKMWEEEGWKKGLNEGIKGTVAMLRDFGHKDAEIKQATKKKYNLTTEQAEE